MIRENRIRSLLPVVVFSLATAFDYAWLKAFAWPLYFVNLALLGATLVIGVGVGAGSSYRDAAT